MQQSAQIPLLKGDKVSKHTDYRDSLPVNMYAVKRSILGASGYMLCHSGLSHIATGAGIDRGSVYNDRLGLHLRVSGDQLISIDPSGMVTNLGTVPGQDQVTMAEFYSFNTQAVIADGKMFLYSPSTGFDEITDANLGTPIDGVWVDGYYFLTDGEYIYHTDLADETAIDPLKFATAEFIPDRSLAVGKTQDNKVIVFGRYSIEYFINVELGKIMKAKDNKIKMSRWIEAQNIIQKQGFYEKALAIQTKLRDQGYDVKRDMQSYKLIMY
jgi:hypothetical protein